MQTTPSASNRAARRAAALAFATQGLVFISLTTRLPRFSDRWDLSDVELSLVLLMIVLLAGAGSVVSELVARRSDSARTLRAGLLTIAARGPVVAAAPDVGVFVAGLAVYGVGLGMVDATSNMQAVAIEHRYGRPILPSFHGAWTFGGIVGATYALASAHAPLWTAGLVALVPLAALFARYLPREHGEALAEAEHMAGAVAADHAGRPGDGALLHGRHRGPDLGTDLPRRRLRRPRRPGGTRHAALPLASLVLRLAGDGLVPRYGAVPVLRIGAVVASAGARGRGLRTDLAGSGARVHDARRGRRR